MKMFGAVVFLFLFILQDASPNTEVNNCPDGAFAVGESCYFFSTGIMNWFAAQEVKCAHYHYYLDTFLLPLLICFSTVGKTEVTSSSSRVTGRSMISAPTCPRRMSTGLGWMIRRWKVLWISSLRFDTSKCGCRAVRVGGEPRGCAVHQLGPEHGGRRHGRAGRGRGGELRVHDAGLRPGPGHRPRLERLRLQQAAAGFVWIRCRQHHNTNRACSNNGTFHHNRSFNNSGACHYHNRRTFNDNHTWINNRRKLLLWIVLFLTWSLLLQIEVLPILL